MKRLLYIKVLILYILILLGINADAAIKAFTRVNPDSTVNIVGNYAIAGNTVVCLTEKISGYGGTCLDNSSALMLTNNMRVGRFLDIDDDNNTWNSTSSYIELPDSFDASDLTDENKGVVWAGLFWQGRISEQKKYEMHYGVEDSGGGYHFVEIGKGSTNSLPDDLTTIGADQIKLKVDDSAYIDVKADSFFPYSMFSGKTYAAFADVTSVVKPLIRKSGKHVFTVANLLTNEGRERSPGLFGGWSLVVIYAENYKANMRTISVYNGFDVVRGSGRSKPSFTIDNFILPKSNKVKASLSLFASEGEYLYGHRDGSTWAYDWIKISPDNTSYDYMPVPDNHDERNIFDGRLSGIKRDHIEGMYNDLQINNNSIDVDTYDISDLLTRYRDANPDLDKLYIWWSSNYDYVTASMLVFATQIYDPTFCYDYAYKQNNVYLTKEYDTTDGQKIAGTVVANDPNLPIDVSIYLKNANGSKIRASNIKFSIVDINSTQATYKPQSVWVTQPGSAFKTKIDDSVLEVSENYIKNIPVNSLDSNEYFYTYFSLNPKQSKLDMPLKAEVDYDLIFSTSSGSSFVLHKKSFLDKDIPLCSRGDFTYLPTKGIFNVVNSNYATGSTPTGYFDNLPTQVTKRVGNFKVLSLDPDNVNQLKGVSTIVAVDMIDAAAFHDTNASCQELTSSISKRKWVLFENNATSTNFDASIGVSPDFYKNARQNAAFRISYNAMNKNGDIPLLQKESDGTYTILNWRSEWDSKSCKQDMDGNPSNTDSVANYCNKTGNQPSDLVACMKCVYGYDVKMVCSRDNFAIRPEALRIRLFDSNTSAGTIKVAESNTTQNIVAGYDYTIKIDATTYIDDTPSYGYTKSFSDSSIPKDLFAYQWAPSSGVVTTGCNDTSDINESITIVNGTVTDVTKVDQVGEYNLILRDKSWTAVDSDPTYMAHHVGSFFQGGLDCVANSSNVVLTNIAGLNGCEISSEHYNPYLKRHYYDYKLNLLPYRFDLSTIRSSATPNDANATAQNFVYNANIDDNTSGTYSNLNMSYQISGSIKARGKSDLILTNFVADCYAKDIDVTLQRSAYADTNMTLKQSLEVLDQNNTRMSIDFEDANNSKYVVFVPKSSFTKQLNGKANIRIRYNFARDISQAKNPQRITFHTMSVNCKNAAECQSVANSSSTFQPVSTKPINDTIYFYYARAHVPKAVTNGSDGNATGYYEVYCYGSGCNKNYLQAELTGGKSANSDDPRWWINNNHTSSFGKIHSIVQRRSPSHVSVAIEESNIIKLHYDGTKGYPYRAVMKVIPDKWLIYNKYNANADHNEFEAQFNNEDTSGWVGSGETIDTTETKRLGYKDRILTW